MTTTKRQKAKVFQPEAPQNTEHHAEVYPAPPVPVMDMTAMIAAVNAGMAERQTVIVDIGPFLSPPAPPA